MKDVVGHKSTCAALVGDERLITSRNGQKKLRKTTQGWKLCIEWKDGSTTWEPLKNLKESNPIEVSEYVIANKVDHEPDFAWWVPDTLHKKSRIIKAVSRRALKRYYKYGIKVPTNTEEALEIDKETSTSFWRLAIEKEMLSVKQVFEFQPDDKPVSAGYKWIPLQMIFDVKIDFTRKARLVAGGHLTDPPTTLTYSSVVSREIVRLAFLIASLNDLNILVADIGNAYINSMTKEKVYTTA
jgi:hypothetical protein